MLIQAYRVTDYVAGRYVVELYKNMHDVSPTILKINKWKFDTWRLDKWDKTEIDLKKLIPPAEIDKKLIIMTKEKKNKKVGVDLNLDFDMDVRIDIALENIEKDIRKINNRMHTMQLQIARLAGNINDDKGTEIKVKVILPEQEKKIMDHVLAEVEKNKYIAENDIKVDNYSVAVIQRTVRNKEILEAFNLQRIRASKEIKKDLGIELETYPFIIVREDKEVS